MNRVILIKYGELTLKKGNRKLFILSLYNNLKNKLVGMNIRIQKTISYMYIEFDEESLETIKDIINHTFGIHSYHLAYKIPSTMNDIENELLKLANETKFKTFKIETKRSDKSFSMNSIEINNHLGGLLLKNIENINVDVHNPEVVFHVEVKHQESYIYQNSYKGLGGYPVSSLGSGLLMLSGGIDSPVAGYLALKKGISISCLYFESIPHTSLAAREKVITLTRLLSKYTNNINLIIYPFTKIQEAIYKNIDDEYCITIMRRMMYRISEKIAKKNSNHVIINGESVGQVASQTLTSMSVINAVTNMPVIRPVACFDKQEIIEIAKKIDTYDTSILPYEDCCTIFVPKHPVINPKLDKCIEYEKSFDYEKLIEEGIENIIVIKTKDLKNDYHDLF